MIVKYSDLRVLDLEKRLIELGSQIMSSAQKEEEVLFGGNNEALKLFNLMLQLDGSYEKTILVALIKRMFKESPELSFTEMLPSLINWYKEYTVEEKVNQKVSRINTVKRKDWYDLEKEDLRYLFDYSESEGLNFNENLEQRGLFFNLEDWAANY